MQGTDPCALSNLFAARATYQGLHRGEKVFFLIDMIPVPKAEQNVVGYRTTTISITDQPNIS